MTTYTILNSDGEAVETGLSLRDAADEVMRSDSREWDIREDDDGGFVVWSRQQVANRPWSKIGAIFSIKTDREGAEREICEYIVNAGRWPGHCEAITDESYAEMQARQASENVP